MALALVLRHSFLQILYFDSALNWMDVVNKQPKFLESLGTENVYQLPFYLNDTFTGYNIPGSHWVACRIL